MKLVVRPMKVDEYTHVVSYFHDAPDSLLLRMGVDRALLPPQDSWLAQLQHDGTNPPACPERLWLCWLVDSQAAGHSSLNDITLGHDAKIHLHLWRPQERRRGLGTKLFDLSVRYAFDALDLARLYCEPKADNSAPNRVAEKLGFQFLETRWTKPGPINFEQQTNLYALER